MLRRLVLAAFIGAASLTSVTDARAADANVRPECGDWMIFVKSFAGDTANPRDWEAQDKKAKELAFGLINEIRSKYRLPAYYYPRGLNKRKAELERVRQAKAAIIARQEAFAKQMGMPIDSPRTGVRMIRVKVHHSVLIGGWDTQEEARQALAGIRKLDPPSDRFMDGWLPPEVVQAKSISRDTLQLINPFKMAFVSANPTGSAGGPDDPYAKLNDPIIKRLNDGSDYSILDCPKSWTLMVKPYYAPTTVQTRGGLASVVETVTGKKKDYLTAAAEQANEVAKFLRSMKPTPYPAYVMHTQYASFVTVGAFDSPNAPELQRAQRALAGLKLGAAEQLIPNPLPMPVPFRKH